MVEKRQQRKTGARGGGTKRTTRGAGTRSKSSVKDVDLADLEKAGEHLLLSAAELFVGAGFAIKGVKGLLQEEEGRKFLRELPFNVITKGFDMVKEAEEEYRARKGAQGKTNKSKTYKSKRSRKINVE